MVRLSIRGLVGLFGALGLLVALQLWLNPNAVATNLGLNVLGPIGTATIRADLAGFFGGAGALALAGAILGQARLLTAPLLLVALALAGRVLTVAMGGLTPEMVPPMVIEAVLIVVFALGRRFI